MKVKAYGKILLFGAYSLLEPGNIGLVVNIDKGTTVTADKTDIGKMVFDLKDFRISVTGDLEDGNIFFHMPPPELKFMRNAVQHSLEYLQRNQKEVSPLKLESVNDPELTIKGLKAGFGTSATSTVATVAAVLGIHGIDNRELVFRIASYSHFFSQGGVGSGFDVSAACYGSHFFTSTGSDEKSLNAFLSKKIPETEEFFWPPKLIPVLCFTGKSANTSSFVKKVLDHKKKQKEKYDALMKSYNEINLACRDALCDNNLDRIKHYLERSWDYRKKLGEAAGIPIETEAMSRLIEGMKRNGAFTAGLVGAGGGDSLLALCLTPTDKERLYTYLDEERITVFDTIKLISEGYEITEKYS
jgi:phosphomevalonate kinase